MIFGAAVLLCPCCGGALRTSSVLWGDLGQQLGCCEPVRRPGIGT